MRLFRTLPASAAAVLPLVLFSLPVLAEEAETGEKGGGLPQFDLSFYPEQIFWGAVSFAVLFLLMTFLVVPRISRTQGDRKNVIAKEIESARRANEEAKASVASAEKSLSDSRAKAQEDIGEMLAKVTEEASERHAAQERELLRKLHRAEEEIAIARTAALDEVRSVATDLARTVVDRVLDVKKRVKA